MICEVTFYKSFWNVVFESTVYLYLGTRLCKAEPRSVITATVVKGIHWRRSCRKCYSSGRRET